MVIFKHFAIENYFIITNTPVGRNPFTFYMIATIITVV